MFYVRGESIDGEYYEFTPAGRTLDEIKELIYRGHDGRLYNFDTDEPVED